MPWRQKGALSGEVAWPRSCIYKITPAAAGGPGEGHRWAGARLI